MKRQINLKEDGSVLFIAMVVIMMIAGFTAAVLDREITAVEAQAFNFRLTQAHYAAEAGLDHAINVVNDAAEAGLDDLTVDAVTMSGSTEEDAMEMEPWFEVPVGNIIPWDNDGIDNDLINGVDDAEEWGYTVQAVGHYQWLTYTITAEISPDIIENVDLAMFGDVSVLLAGTVDTDSYDSDVAVYDPAVHNQNGDIASNGTISVGSNNDIEGSLSAQTGILDAGATISGASTSPAPEVPLPPVTYNPPLVNDNGGVNWPNQGDLIMQADILPDVDWMYAMHDAWHGRSAGGGPPAAPGDTLAEGSYHLNSLRLGATTTLSITGDVVLYINDSLDIAGSAKIDIQVGASLTIYLDGDASIAGNSIQNQNMDASSLNLYGTGDDTNTINIAGTADWYGTVYAPDVNIVMRGTAGYYGSVVGETIDANGTFDFHYDEALANDDETPDFTNFQKRSWKVD